MWMSVSDRLCACDLSSRMSECMSWLRWCWRRHGPRAPVPAKRPVACSCLQVCLTLMTRLKCPKCANHRQQSLTVTAVLKLKNSGCCNISWDMNEHYLDRLRRSYNINKDSSIVRRADRFGSISRFFADERALLHAVARVRNEHDDKRMFSSINSTDSMTTTPGSTRCSTLC